MIFACFFLYLISYISTNFNVCILHLSGKRNLFFLECCKQDFQSDDDLGLEVENVAIIFSVVKYHIRAFWPSWSDLLNVRSFSIKIPKGRFCPFFCTDLTYYAHQVIPPPPRAFQNKVTTHECCLNDWKKEWIDCLENRGLLFVFYCAHFYFTCEITLTHSSLLTTCLQHVIVWHIKAGRNIYVDRKSQIQSKCMHWRLFA